jgi:hypothetical protein
MNRFIKVFMVVFSVGLVVIFLNMFAQYGFPLVGDWRAITTNALGAFPYILLIFLGFFFLLERGK